MNNAILSIAMKIIAITVMTASANAEVINVPLTPQHCVAAGCMDVLEAEVVESPPVEREAQQSTSAPLVVRNPWKAFLRDQGSRTRMTDPELTGTRDAIAKTYRERPEAFHPGAIEETIRILNTHHGMELSSADELATFILSDKVKVRKCSDALFSRVYVTRYNIDTKVGDPDWSRDYCYMGEYELVWFDKSREYRGVWRPFLVSGCLNPVVERDIPFVTPPINLGTVPTVRCPEQVDNFTHNGATCVRRKP